MKMKWYCPLLALVIATGCGHYESAPVDGQSGSESQTDAQPAQPPPDQAAQQIGDTANAAAAPQRPSNDATQRPTNVKKADVGMGKRGRNYGGGIVTEPVRARFRAEERIALGSVDHALNLFKAENDRLPKSHEEFMEKIIQFNNIALPPLPPGEEYWFDAEIGQLMVRHPE